MSNDNLPSLDALAKEELANADVSIGPDKYALNIEDLHERFKHFLTPSAAVVFDKTRKSTLHVYAVEAEEPGMMKYADDCSKVIYLSTMVKGLDQAERAARAIYDVVNDLHSLGVLRGNLCKLSHIALATENLDLRISEDKKNIETVRTPVTPKWVIFCFPHVDWHFGERVKYQHEEGALIPDFEGE